MDKKSFIKLAPENNQMGWENLKVQLWLRLHSRFQGFPELNLRVLPKHILGRLVEAP